MARAGAAGQRGAARERAAATPRGAPERRRAGAGDAGGVTGAAGAGGAAWLTPPTVPAALAVPTGATLAIHNHAIGQQVYTCTAMSTWGAGGGGAGGAGGAGTSYAWVLKQPDAKLYDMDGTQVAARTAPGPNWTSTDGSIANGTKIAQADSPQSECHPLAAPQSDALRFLGRVQH